MTKKVPEWAWRIGNRLKQTHVVDHELPGHLEQLICALDAAERGERPPPKNSEANETFSPEAR